MDRASSNNNSLETRRSAVDGTPYLTPSGAPGRASDAWHAERAASLKLSQASYDFEYRRPVAVYVVYDRDTQRVLMEWRTPPWPPCNLWCFGSGRVDGNESGQEAALRELHEELGLTALHAEDLGSIVDTTGRRFRVTFVDRFAWQGEFPRQNADQGYPLGWFKLKHLPTSAMNDVSKAVAALVAEHLAGAPRRAAPLHLEAVA